MAWQETREKVQKNFKNLSSDKISAELVEKVVEELLSFLKDRQREIISRRFGLMEKNKPMVLEEIGKEFGITRERVRQIENDCFRRLQKISKSESFKKIENRAVEILDEFGGFCKKKLLKEKILPNLSLKDRNRLMFVLNSSPKLSFKKNNLQLGSFWSRKEKMNKIAEELKYVHQLILNILEQKGSPVFFDELWQLLLEDKRAKKILAEKKGEQKLRMILKISKVFEKNILEEWGLRRWRTIAERGSREKAYLVLKKEGKPLHFRQITNRINQLWKNKKALPQTVHNELIKDRRFVLVGRGIYGLREWGVKEGTVKELIIDILKTKKKPLHKHEIIEHILSIKKVKRTTVLVNLSDKLVFQRTEEGKFFLK